MYGRGNRCLLHKPGRCGEGLAMGPGSKAELHSLGRLRRCACSLRASPRSQAATPRRCWAPAENSGSRRAPLACSEATAPLRCNGVHFSLQSPGVSRDLRICLLRCVCRAERSVHGRFADRCALANDDAAQAGDVTLNADGGEHRRFNRECTCTMKTRQQQVI